MQRLARWFAEKCGLIVYTQDEARRIQQCLVKLQAQRRSLIQLNNKQLARNATIMQRLQQRAGRDPKKLPAVPQR